MLRYDLVTAIAISVFALGEARADWPQFRGPAGNGVFAGDLPVRWSESSNVAWSAEVPGSGWSAPLITGDRVIVTTAIPVEGDRSGVQRFALMCFDLESGEERWSAVAVEQPSTIPTHRDNTFASETPVTDGERVYAYFGMNGVYCYTLDGEQVWLRDLGSFPMQNGWGCSSSLAYDEGRVFVQIDNERDSHVVALDAGTGETLWRVERPDEPSNWCSPIVWRNRLRSELIIAGKTVRSYDPASGAELWSLAIGGRSTATPVAVGDTLVVGSENRSRRGGTPGGLFAIRAGATGQIDLDDAGGSGGLLWANERGAIGIASPLVVGDSIFVLPRRGAILRVHSLADGSQQLRRRMPGGTAFWASPWASDDRVYLLDDAGTVFVLDPADDGFEPVEVNRLPGRFWSTPAAAEGVLVLRSEDRLYCVRSMVGG